MRMFQPMHKNQDPVLWSVVHTWNGAQINEKISPPFPKLCVKVFYLSPVSGSVGNQSHGSEIQHNYFSLFQQVLRFAIFTTAKAKEIFSYLALWPPKASVWTAISRL